MTRKALFEQQKREALSQAAKIVLARRDLTAFCEYVLRDPTGAQIKAAPIHQSWVDHLYYCWKIAKPGVVLAPFSMGKTAWFGLGLPLWLLGQNPNLRITMISSAEDIAAKRLQKVAEFIEQSKEYHEVFPWVKIDKLKPNNAHALNVKRESESGSLTGSIDYSMAAYGYTSSEGQGSRTDVLILDDVVDEKNSCMSPAARKNLIGLVTTQWISRTLNCPPLKSRDSKLISRKALVCGIGTRFHAEDLYGFLIDAPTGYCTMIQGVSQDFTHMDVEVIGALEDSPHPVVSQYYHWRPDAVQTPNNLVELI